MLDVDDLHAYYGKSHILRGVTFRVGEGEIVSLLGRNGAGRSTVVKTIMGQVRPVGSVRFRGVRIDGLEPYQIARKGLGYVPEDREIFPALTVRENLLLGMKSFGASGRWSFDEVFRLFPVLRERADAPGGVLSGGEQQLLTICRTLMGDPDLVMIDEPTEGLAPRLVEQAEADDRARDFAPPLCDGTGTHRVRGQRAGIARQSRRAQRMARGMNGRRRSAPATN